MRLSAAAGGLSRSPFGGPSGSGACVSVCSEPMASVADWGWLLWRVTLPPFHCAAAEVVLASIGRPTAAYKTSCVLGCL